MDAHEHGHDGALPLTAYSLQKSPGMPSLLPSASCPLPPLPYPLPLTFVKTPRSVTIFNRNSHQIGLL